MLSVTELLKAVEIAGAWLKDIINSRINRKEHDAARLLEAAGILVVALSVLDNTMRGIFSKIRLDAARLDKLTDQDRSRIMEEINVFVINEEILKTIRISQDNLRDANKEGIIEDVQLIEEILHCAEKVVNAVDTGFSPFASREEFYKFLSVFEHDNASDQEKRLLKHMCDEIFDVYDRKIIAGSQHALGKLTAQVMNEYKLPSPDWLKIVPGA